MPTERRLRLRFVRALLPGGTAERREGGFVLSGGAAPMLPEAEVAALASAGVLQVKGNSCRATAEAAGWLRRQLLGDDAHATQHRELAREADGVVRNLAESPLARLAAGKTPFLAPHQVAAGERVRQLVDRARMLPRVTMSYSGRVAGGARNGAAEIPELAADARKRLAELYRQLPRDCAEVVLDVCGLEKGLQQVETERGWPRRSAKLVLRIGLERLAELLGLSAVAEGQETGRQRAEMLGERLPMFD